MENVKRGMKVKFTYPDKNEENLVFVVTNVNNITKRVIIQCLNSGMKIEPSETVGFCHIERI